MVQIYDFSINYNVNPTLIPIRDLRFGWKLDSDEADVLQQSYRITILKDAQIVADTGIVLSQRFFNISLDGLVLESRTDYTIKITVSDNKNNIAEYVHTATTEILPDEWDAKWIKPKKHMESWAPYLRTKFQVKGVKKATLYACGLGCAEYYLNGKRTDDYLIDPPSTNYEKTVYYRAFDVTEMINDGGNALTVLLGEGFYSQSKSWGMSGLRYGDVCAIIRLEMTLNDGTVRVVTSNTEDWTCKYSPISYNNLYGGEIYDSRLETEGFADFDGSETGWDCVIEDETPKGELTPCFMPAVQEIRSLPAVSVHLATGKEDARWIFDIGENIAGFAEFVLPPSHEGRVYVFRYAENLDENGQLDMRSAGVFHTQCLPQDIYITKGNPNGETYRPRFTYHGFRYIELSGVYYDGGSHHVLETSMVRGIQIATGMEQTANIKTSHQDLNKLLSIMKNTFVSNYHGYPEDCPAREKCGWLGDAQVVSNYGLLNFDSVSSYRKYMKDIKTSREVYGTWQMIAPGKRTCGDASPLWGCAQIIIPYYMYKYYGDTDTVLKYFDLMEAWVQHELDRSEDYIISEGLGDWCQPESNGLQRRMPVCHSSTLMFYEICIKMAELCAVFGIGNREYYKELARKIKDSFIKHFYDCAKHSYGFWGTDGVALEIELYPDGERNAMIKSLLDTMEEEEYAMPTGIYGNKYLVPLLAKEGYGECVLKFLFNRDHASFATMMDDGATTIWEQVDMKNIADRGKGVSSFNHPMHGGFLYFVIEDLCGIKAQEPGFTKIRFSPAAISTVEEISAELKLISGKVAVNAANKNGTQVYELTIPAGITAVLDIKGCIKVDGEICCAGTEIGSGKHVITVE